MVSGGKRINAGRKLKHGEPTKVVRIPESMVTKIYEYIENKGNSYPLFLNKVPAGFPSPADDHMDKLLSLDDYCIQNPSATFFLRVSGDSMIDAGIFPDDLLIVDRSIEARHGKIVIASLNGELTVKRLYRKNGKILLQAENKKYQPIEIPELSELNIWGVVTNVIHKTT